MARIVSALEPVGPARREAILAGPSDPETHAALLAAMPFTGCVEVAPPPTPRPDPGPSARIVAWNTERCRSPARAAALLADADAALLTELDVGMARSGQAHTPRELAAALGAGYAFGVEFLELGLGSEAERAAHAGASNRVGYHGGAVVSAHPLRRPDVVRLEERGDWFGPGRGERRVGSRIAVLAGLLVAGREIILAAVHLDSHGDPAERTRELGVLLDAIDARHPGAPALIGGDLNTHSLGRAELRDRELLERALEVDPRRLRDPLAHEPLFSVAARAGYEWRSCNAMDSSTQRITSEDGSSRGALRLDWFLARGLVCEEPAVIAAVDASTGAALSDHEALAVTIRPA